MRPRWRVAGAVAIFTVLEWYGATSEVTWLFLLGWWVAAMVAVAAVYALLNRRGLTLRLTVDNVRPSPQSPVHDLPEQVLRTAPHVAVVFEGDRFDLGIALDPKGKERGPAWVTGMLGNTSLAIGAGVVPRTGWRSFRSFEGSRRTVLGAAGWNIHTGDPLGFFQGEISCPDSEVGLVYPLFASLRGRRQTRELEAAAAAPRAGAGSELFGIREYTSGDSLRRIHWRSSARHGQLVVREYEPPGVETLAIYLDPSPPDDKAGDQVARIAASEAWDCIRGGGRVVLWAPGLRASPPAQGRDLWTLLDWLARYPGEAPPEPAVEPAPAGSEAIVVTASADSRLVDALEGARRRGAHARAWVVGDGELGLDVETERAGVEWPL